VSPASSDTGYPVELVNEAATHALAGSIAAEAQIGDVIALAGELGTGKTSFARAFVRALGVAEEVPSPTFTLVQTYDTSRGTVWHFDLYRLARPADAYELGIEEAFGDGITLIEWPERLGSLLPRERLDIELAIGATPESRQAVLHAAPSWTERLARIVTHG
jgi:tRNA threonylcarbamoyladenosine biosynthesis protein TsaE